MNIRVDDTNIMEITQTSSKVEIKGNVAVTTEETTTRQVEAETGKVFSVQQTKVDSPLFPEETQMEKIQRAAQQEELQQFQKKLETVSNTASEQDCGLLEEDGFSLGGTEVDTIVTEMDKIKMELAQAGADISIFGDGLSSQQLEEMAGSTALANQLESAIKQADLPATEENLSDCQEAISQASTLTGCTQEMVKFMVENELPPTVENFYKAQHSTSNIPHAAPPGVPMDEALKAQVEQVIAQAGLEADGTSMAYSQWMLDNQIPLTAENLKYAIDLQNIQLPPAQEQVIGAVVEAIAEGARPADAIILDGYSLADRAQQAMETIAQATDAEVWTVLEKGLPLTIESLEAVQNAAREAAVSASQGNAASGTGQAVVPSTLEQGTAIVSEAAQAVVPSTLEQGAAIVSGMSQAVVPRTQDQGTAVVSGTSQAVVPDEANQEGSVISGTDSPAASPGVPSTGYSSEELRFAIAKRQLEETRLIMTIQANYTLLKRGISIETKPLEDLVAELKALEEDYYKSLLSQHDIPVTEESTEAFAGTINKTRELQTAPAYILGSIRPESDSLDAIHEAGMASQAELERAGEAYDTLKTEPRPDLGDSIQKAFQNVDDILKDLGLDATEPNQRAVRILAYNQMEITEPSIVQIKAVDQKVQNLFQNLSPAVVLEMIREGSNPLEMSVDQLNAKAEEIKSRIDGEGEEKFSKFLYKLEQRQEITPQERDSYIGIYRLLRQIDKTDGAVVGALLHQGADLTMKNLLSAVRTHRNAGINVSIDDSFGEADELPSQELSISEQIEAAYQTDCAKEAFGMVTPEGIQQAQAQGEVGQMTPEELLWQLRQAQVDTASEESYYQEQLKEFSHAKEAEAQVLQMLSSHDMPATAYNIMAATRLAEGRNIFKALFSHESLNQEINLEEVKASILEDFAEAIKTPEEMAKAQEKLAEVAENVMKTMIESPDIRNMDIREMKVMRQQIELGARLSKEETYAIPVLVADELTNVQLKIVRGKKERGKLDIIFDSPKLGKVAANFQVQPDSIKAYIVSDSRQTANSLRAQEESLRGRLGFMGEGDFRWEMNVVYSDHVDLSHFASTEVPDPSQQDQESDSYQVQTKELYGMAKAFLEEVKHMED